MAYTLIYNPNSGSCTPSVVEQVEQAFLDAGSSVELVDLTTCDLSQTVDHLARKGKPVIAAGGDGTISAVASEAVRTGATLGVIPLGTLNHFAKDIGISPDIKMAVSTLLKGNTSLVDVGSLNGRIFLNNSSIGLYPRIVALRKKLQKGGYSKLIAAAIASAKYFFRIPKIHVRLAVNGEKVYRTTSLVFVGNNRYNFSGFDFGSRAGLDCGLLSVVILRPTTGLKLLLLVAKDLLGDKPHPKEMEVFNTSEVRIKVSHPTIRVAADGEVFHERAPLEYKILPKSLRVIVPIAPRQK